MKTASAYTNQKRVMAEAGNLKVDQIGKIATNYGDLQPVLPSQASPLMPVACGPDFTTYTYFKGCIPNKYSNCVNIGISSVIETLVAGQLETVTSAVEGYGTSGKFHSVFGIISIDNDTFLIVDRSYFVIYKYTISTNYVSIFAGQDGMMGTVNGTTFLNSKFDYINDIAYDVANKILYVATNTNIRKLDLNTNTISTLINSQVGYMFWSIVYANGYLYGIDLFQSVMFKLNVSTAAIQIIAGAVSAGLGYVDGIGSVVRFNFYNDTMSILAFDNNSTIYIADGFNGKIRKLNILTNEVSTVSNAPDIISVKYNGILYYQTTDNKIYSITPTSTTKIVTSNYNLSYGFSVLFSNLIYALARNGALIKISINN